MIREIRISWVLWQNAGRETLNDFLIFQDEMLEAALRKDPLLFVEQTMYVYYNRGLVMAREKRGSVAGGRGSGKEEKK